MASVNPGIAIDYTSKDYNGFLNSMLQYATLAFPEWTNQNPGGLEMMLLESFSRELDVLSYYGDRIAAEAYISTATQLSSVIKLAELLGYTPGQPMAATGTVTLQTEATQTTDVAVPKGTQVTTNFVTSLNAPLVYETTADTTVPNSGGTIVVAVAQGETQGSASFVIGNATGYLTTVQVETLGISDGSIQQEFTLANNPVVSDSVTVYVENPDFDSTIVDTLLDPIVPWNEVATLMDATSSDIAYTLSTDASGVVTVAFGDNINGAIPSSGLTVYANYRVGGGTAGNIASNQITDIATAISGIFVASSSAMTGGAAAESIDQIRVNAPRAFRTQNRAVTLQDFADLALGVSSVSSANAIATNFNNVTVYCTAVGNTTPSQGLLDQVVNYLQPRALAGATVTAQSASFVTVNIGSTGTPVLIGCLPRYNPVVIQTKATQAIQGLFAPDKVSFGQRVALSSVYAVINQIPGIAYVTIPLMARSDATQSGAQDVVMRSWEIPAAGNIVVSASASV